jgi:PEP-CTERM motif
MSIRFAHIVSLVATATALGWSGPATAGPILLDTFYQFSFTDVGVSAQGCDPADPAGAFCTPSSGTLTEFLDAPPWTFLAPATGVFLTVLDAFSLGEQFEIFDFGASLGLTSVPGGGDCGDDPIVCLADTNASSGIFSLLAGNHSITITPTLSPDGLGAGYLRIQADAVVVPEPQTIALVGIGMLGLWGRRAWR